MENSYPFVIIRRGGYYVNVIANNRNAIREWKSHNIIRTNPKGKVNKGGTRAMRTLAQSIRLQKLSFFPATAQEVRNAPCFCKELMNRSGMIVRA